MEVKQIQWFDDHYYKIQTQFSKQVTKEWLDKNKIVYYEGPQNTVDIYLPSTTSKHSVINKPFLNKWRGDLGNEKADQKMHRAADRGSRIHLAWYTINSGGCIIFNPDRGSIHSEKDLKEYRKKYQVICELRDQGEMYDVYKLIKWLKVVKPHIYSSEQIVYSLEMREAGQIDSIVFIKEGKYEIANKPVKIEEGYYVLDVKAGKNIHNTHFYQTAAYAMMASLYLKLEIKGTIILHTQAKQTTGIPGIKTIIRTEEIVEDFKRHQLASDLWFAENPGNKPKVFSFPSIFSPRFGIHKECFLL